eukprot:507830-Amphidinium_carterae.2
MGAVQKRKTLIWQCAFTSAELRAAAVERVSYDQRQALEWRHWQLLVPALVNRLRTVGLRRTPSRETLLGRQYQDHVMPCKEFSPLTNRTLLLEHSSESHPSS